MNANPSTDSQEHSSVLTIGVTDLMTSLAVIFILLFSAYVTKVSETESQAKVSVIPPVPERKIARTTTDDIKGLLRDHFNRFDLSLDADTMIPMWCGLWFRMLCSILNLARARCRRSRINSWRKQCRAMQHCFAALCEIESIHL